MIDDKEKRSPTQQRREQWLSAPAKYFIKTKRVEGKRHLDNNKWDFLYCIV